MVAKLQLLDLTGNKLSGVPGDLTRCRWVGKCRWAGVAAGMGIPRSEG